MKDSLVRLLLVKMLMDKALFTPKICDKLRVERTPINLSWNQSIKNNDRCQQIYSI